MRYPCGTPLTLLGILQHQKYYLKSISERATASSLRPTLFYRIEINDLEWNEREPKKKKNVHIPTHTPFSFICKHQYPSPLHLHFILCYYVIQKFYTHKHTYIYP